jgi:hypothetical protein
MYVDVPHLDCLLVAAPIALEGLDHLILKPKQLDGEVAVTPPAEVHGCPTVHSAPCTTRYRCLPTGVTGSRSRPTPPGFGQIVLCRPDAWVRVSFAHTRVSIVGWIYDPDHTLPPGMYVDVPHLDCLLFAPPITLEGLDHVILKRPAHARQQYAVDGRAGSQKVAGYCRRGLPPPGRPRNGAKAGKG